MLKSLLVGLTVGLIACGNALCAPDPTGAKYWTSDDPASLKPGEKLVSGKSHYARFIHKESGNPAKIKDAGNPAEIHETVAEFWIVMEGQAKVQVGGKMGPTTKMPNGTVSDTLEGGTMYDLKKGVVMYVPVGVPHQVHVAPGQLNILIPSWTQKVAEHIFASHLEDRPALLQSLRAVGDGVRAGGAAALVSE